MRKQHAISIAAGLFVACAAMAIAPAIRETSVAPTGMVPARSEFISYDIREEAEAGDPAKCQNYLSLNDKWQREMSRQMPIVGVTRHNARIDVPYMWLDRDVFIHVEGVERAYRLLVNGREVGRGDGSRTPLEFAISEFIHDGGNTVSLEVMVYRNPYGEDAKAPRNVYIYSQPKVRIHDFYVRALSDSLGKGGVLTVDVIVSNSYRDLQNATIGYDIYSPEGKLRAYDMKTLTLEGNGLDTLRFTATLGDAMSLWAWSPAKPNLYKLMLTLARNKRLVEYIPLTVGFKSSWFKGNELIFNGKPMKIDAAGYNATSTEKAASADLKTLRGAGINTICVDYPQPIWFYDLCDRIGLLVIDQADINYPDRDDDRRVGGTPSNDPYYLYSYLARMDVMQNRTKSHTCVVAWSMGGKSGNGYNLYKGYQSLKAADSLNLHPVTYRDPHGEWNCDFEFPTVRDAAQILQQARPAAKIAAKPRR